MSKTTDKRSCWEIFSDDIRTMQKRIWLPSVSDYVTATNYVTPFDKDIMKPLTDEEAEKEYAEAPEIPLTEKEKSELVDMVLSRDRMVKYAMQTFHLGMAKRELAAAQEENVKLLRIWATLYGFIEACVKETTADPMRAAEEMSYRNVLENMRALEAGQTV